MRLVPQLPITVNVSPWIVMIYSCSTRPVVVSAGTQRDKSCSSFVDPVENVITYDQYCDNLEQQEKRDFVADIYLPTSGFPSRHSAGSGGWRANCPFLTGAIPRQAGATTTVYVFATFRTGGYEVLFFKESLQLRVTEDLDVEFDGGTLNVTLSPSYSRMVSVRRIVLLA